MKIIAQETNYVIECEITPRQTPADLSEFKDSIQGFLSEYQGNFRLFFCSAKDDKVFRLRGMTSQPQDFYKALKDKGYILLEEENKKELPNPQEDIEQIRKALTHYHHSHHPETGDTALDALERLGRLERKLGEQI